jgi:hypothetical protein
MLDCELDIEQKLTEIVGRDDIVNDSSTLHEYSTDYSFAASQKPMFVVYPQNTEEIQSIVRLANESKMPLIPVSSGPPHFHGDTVPGQGGVIVNMSKMKRVLRIDTRNRAVMIEPGVTFGELVPELRKQGLKLTGPLLPRVSKSVLISCIEREPTLQPKYQFDYIDPLLTLGVVFGTGDIFRTGSASGPGSLEELKADKVNPWGPGQNDFVRFVSGAQGTMGIATWGIRKVEVMPSIQKLFFIAAPLEQLIETMDLLLRQKVDDECLILNNVNLAAILSDSEKESQNLREKLPKWTLLVSVAGYQRHPEKRVEIQEKYLFNIAQGIGVKPTPSLPGAKGKDTGLLALLGSPWAKEPYWKLRYNSVCHDIFFLTSMHKIPEFVSLMSGIADKYGYPNAGIGCYLQPVVQGHGCHCEFSLSCDPSSSKEVENVKSIFLEASEVFMERGAFFSRPYGPWADMVFGRYGEGTQSLKKLKGIFDPNNILNPGKICF